MHLYGTRFVGAVLSVVFVASEANAFAEVKTKEITYKSGGTELLGFVAWDDATKEKRPGVLVVHEWWGHNAHARNQAIRLAKEGYIAFALDMYGKGKVATHPKDAQAFMAEATKDPEHMRARFLAAWDALKKESVTDTAKVAAVGYCFGGGVVLKMAREGMDLRAVVSMHGAISASTPTIPKPMKAEVLVLNGADDKMVTTEQMDALKKELAAQKAKWEVVNLPGAKHSFTNPEADSLKIEGIAYNERADRDSFDAMLKLFRRVFGK